MVGLGLLALIFSAVAPKGEEASAPAASPAQTAPAQTAAGTGSGPSAAQPSGGQASGSAGAPEAAGTASAGASAGGTGANAGNGASGTDGSPATGTGTAGGTSSGAAGTASEDQAGGTTQAAASEEKQQLQFTSFTGKNGAELYTQACQSCHMPEGRGAQGAGRYPALANNPRTASTPYVVTMILNGNGGMPGFGHYLSDAQIAEIVNYVRDDLNKQTDQVAPADVQKLRPQNPDYMIFGESAG
ncbi:hypothetical protein DEIPH_ctg030orf0035 [Deinococcus phoenicis]|uniref:Cytochrome c domain-containing protein n=1 Tax=Deinococcus phoenicis TaxID=1476583 RepID=A0A016QPT2_9DEIO|nr:hypothetical protein DEIPH_ctg030orf0035 [Deinococcus phoenicis]